jgi:pyrimidine operon attenuation protein/uracil phosphoribosyltransferase
MGRPKKIMLAVLIDRGYRELPIEPNFMAVEVSAGKNELVEVMLEEDDGIDQVIITENNLK